MLDREPCPLLKWSEAARALGVTERQIRHLWSTSRLGGVHVGRHVRFRIADIAEFIAAHSTPPTNDCRTRQDAATPPAIADGATSDLPNQVAPIIAQGGPDNGTAPGG